MPHYDSRFWDGLLEQVLIDAVKGPTLSQATALVGMLHHFRIRLSRQFWYDSINRGEECRLESPALELPYATAVVAERFGYDRGLLLGLYRNHWHELRRSRVFKDLKRAVERHRFVGLVVAYSRVA